MRRQRTFRSVSSRPVDAPDVALHRANRGRTVGEEVVAAEVQEGLPRVLERRRDRVDGVGPAGAERAGRGKHLRPLRLAAAREVGERVLVGRGDLAHELPVLHPRGVEHLHVADAVGEDRPRAVAVEATVDERLRHRVLFRRRQHLADGPDAVDEAEAAVAEADEAPCPERFDLQRVSG